MEIWQTVIYIFIILTFVAFLAFLIFILLRNTKASFSSSCKSNSSCSQNQICQGEKCVSEPGFPCSNNEQCSSYAPLCHPTEHYCTNFPKNPRGTAGNPPPPDKDGKCEGQLVLNSAVNLCQQVSIGAVCSKDVECNLGLCNGTTCQYASVCTAGNDILNPHQCSPGLECSPTVNLCEVPGIPAGADGAPCSSTADCKIGNTCILGPPGSTWQGICKSGQLSWLTLFSDPKQQCISPLMGGGGWCRYDIPSFMQCNVRANCQAPYSQCSSDNYCIPAAGQVDPIEASGFHYIDIGYNLASPSSPISGSFYIPSFPSNEQDDITGGKLLTQYFGFLSSSSQFPDVFGGKPIMSFSAVTSFTVASFSRNTSADYHTAIEDDRNNAVLVNLEKRNNIINLNVYRESLYQLNAQISFGVNLQSRLWTPATVVTESPVNNDVFFIQNPISSLRIDFLRPLLPGDLFGMHYGLWIKPTGTGYQDYFLTLFYMKLGSVGPFRSKILDLDVSTKDLIILSWDAISTLFTTTNRINMVIFFFGLDRITGKYQLFKFTAIFDTFFNLLSRDTRPQVVPIQDKFSATDKTHVRISRANQDIEPLLVATFFITSPEGLTVSSFLFPSDGSGLDFSGDFTCSYTQVFSGVTGLSFVTSVTGSSAIGNCFAVKCTMPHVDNAFLVIQVNLACRNKILTGGYIYSAIYWRHLNGENTNYVLYPIGGSGLPFFLATPTPLTFDGFPPL